MDQEDEGGSSLRKGIMRDYVNNKAEGKKRV